MMTPKSEEEDDADEEEEDEARDSLRNMPLRTGNHATFSSSANAWVRNPSRGFRGAR